MQPLPIRIVNKSSNPLPTYVTTGASGMDLRASLEGPVALKPLERTLIPTGLYIELPSGFEAQVRPRSGIALKQGLTCLNSPGTIDSDYRGEIRVLLVNLSSENQVIHHGDRIAQLVVQKVERVIWEEVGELDVTVRNAGGFGHTGKN
ncbi:MAG TPA: dUTP diphosphatase [Chitinophagaceae bacterium]|nr:dUTP diphosphatase [Chitinophagaceae bacterium]